MHGFLANCGFMVYIGGTITPTIGHVMYYFHNFVTMKLLHNILVVDNENNLYDIKQSINQFSFKSNNIIRYSSSLIFTNSPVRKQVSIIWYIDVFLEVW